MRPLPKVLLVGGPDVDARLELMHRLSTAVDISAAGSLPGLRDKFTAQGFRYNPYPLNRRVNPIGDLLTIGQLFLIFRRLKPQIVHTFDTKPGVWGCLAARLAGVPVVITTLTGLGSLYSSKSLTTRLLRGIYQSLQKLACWLADLTIFQNRDDARQFIAEGVVPAEKAMVIPGSGIATEQFAPARISPREQAKFKSEVGVQPGEIVVTMISRVIRSKGVLEFMAAARVARLDHPHARFLLIGPPDDDSVDRLGPKELEQLKQVVIWPGPRNDIPAVLAASDIFVLPSAYGEGIPRVLLEAASMGLPIVTTDSHGCNDVVQNGVNGFVIPVRDAAALSQAIGCLIEQPKLRQSFGQASRQRALQYFDLSVVADQTRSVYQQLLVRKTLLPAVTATESG